jgi:hypothetical protein
MNTLPFILFMKSFSRLFSRGTLLVHSSGQLLHALRAFLRSTRLLFSRLCSAGQSCQPAYQRSDSYHERCTANLHPLDPLSHSSVVTHVNSQDVMASPETKVHFSINESVYTPPDTLAPNTPSLRPTFHQSSGPALGISAHWNVISSPDGRLRIIPMSAEGVQGQRYDSGNRDPM